MPQVARVIVLEAAVLFEAGWQDIGDEVWVNIIGRKVAIARTMQRDGITRVAVENRLDSQICNAERIARADLVIDNNGTLEQLLTHWRRVSA
jgi:dephospho-CoA kinase